jgi:hypothetical protein
MATYRIEIADESDSHKACLDTCAVVEWGQVETLIRRGVERGVNVVTVTTDRPEELEAALEADDDVFSYEVVS